MKRTLYIALLFVGVLNISWISPLDESIELIFFVNTSVTDSELSKSQIEDIYFGDKTVWKNRNKITPCYLDNNQSAGKVFFNEFIKETPTVFNRHWVKLIFSGYSQAPKDFGNSKQIIEYVNENAGTIGFILKKDKDLLQDNCKVLTIR